MTRRERELEQEGRLAAGRGIDLASSDYSRLRSSASRIAFRTGYEAERRRMTAERITPEQLAESQAAIAALKEFSKTML